MDIEKAKAIKASSDWEAICVELDRWIQGYVMNLKTCEADKLTLIQTRISAYEEVKQLPLIVIDREE